MKNINVIIKSAFVLLLGMTMFTACTPEGDLTITLEGKNADILGCWEGSWLLPHDHYEWADPTYFNNHNDAPSNPRLDQLHFDEDGTWSGDFIDFCDDEYTYMTLFAFGEDQNAEPIYVNDFTDPDYFMTFMAANVDAHPYTIDKKEHTVTIKWLQSNCQQGQTYHYSFDKNGDLVLSMNAPKIDATGHTTLDSEGVPTEYTLVPVGKFHRVECTEPQEPEEPQCEEQYPQMDPSITSADDLVRVLSSQQTNIRIYWSGKFDIPHYHIDWNEMYSAHSTEIESSNRDIMQFWPGGEFGTTNAHCHFFTATMDEIQEALVYGTMLSVHQIERSDEISYSITESEGIYTLHLSVTYGSNTYQQEFEIVYVGFEDWYRTIYLYTHVPGELCKRQVGRFQLYIPVN